MQLCFAMQDTESFRINYMVEKLGVSDPEVITRGVSSMDEFKKVLYSHGGI